MHEVEGSSSRPQQSVSLLLVAAARIAYSFEDRSLSGSLGVSQAYQLDAQEMIKSIGGAGFKLINKYGRTDGRARLPDHHADITAP